MARKRSKWDPNGDAIFADGIRRGLSGEEISSAMRGAGVKGASPATVKRRMLERKGSTRLSKHALKRRESVAPAPQASTARPSSVATEYAFEGDAAAIVAVARARLAAFLGRAARESVFGENGIDHYDALLASASPEGLAYIALFATEDERTGREGEGDDEHAAFLEAHEADHVARARKLIRDALAAIPAAHASSFTVRTEEKAP